VSLRSRLTACLALLSLWITPNSVAGECKLGKIVEFPITVAGLRPQVTAQINGTDVRLMVDSGAFFSLISPASAAELNLALRPAPWELVFRGANGGARASMTKVKEFALSGQKFHDIDFLVAGSQADEGSVGVLGQNILHFADVEYDLAHGVIRLMKPLDCGNKAGFAYWTDPSSSYSVINIESRERYASAIGRASINGTEIRALFDSGAGVSTLTLKAALRVGIRPNSPGVIDGGVSGGFGSKMVATYIAPVESFKIGDEEIRHTKLLFGDFEFGDADMLIGPDFFLSHRIYVANSQQKLYFTYNGGPVFNLTYLYQDAAPGAAKPPGAQSTAADAAPVSGTTDDAADFSRRGTAMAARGDNDHALTRFLALASWRPTILSTSFSAASFTCDWATGCWRVRTSIRR
jgi:hypothetical protein